MKKLAAASAALAVVCLATPSAAQGLPTPNPELTPYVSAGYTYLDGGSLAEFGVATARVGVKAGYIGAEVEGGFGISGETNSGIKSSLKWSLAGYVVGNLPITERVQLLARVGYGTTRVKVSGFGASVSDNIDSVNFGGGAIFSLSDNDHIRVDYTRYDTEGSGGANGYSLVYTRTF